MNKSRFYLLLNSPPQNIELTESMSYKQLQAFCEMLKTNSTIKYIKSYISWGDKGAKWLAEALMQNTSIKTIDLRESQIFDGGACYLGEMLKNNNTLKSLSISGKGIYIPESFISDKGAKAMAAGLLPNSELENLNLEHNHIHKEGAIALAGNMLLFKKPTQGWKNLRLGNNHVSSNGALAVHHVLKTNNDDLTARTNKNPKAYYFFESRKNKIRFETYKLQSDINADTPIDRLLSNLFYKMVKPIKSLSFKESHHDEKHHHPKR